MSPREESVFEAARILSESILKCALVGDKVSVKVRIETVDGMVVTVEANVGR